MKNKILIRLATASFASLLLSLSASAAVTVLTVPFVPKTPTLPHTTYPVNSTTEASIILGATVPSAVGSTDSFTFQWSFGDGTSSPVAAVTNPYDISVMHQYPASAGQGTQWMATVTVTDTTTSQSGSAKYYVIQEQNVLSSRVNVAIDLGLWYLHQTMWRGTSSGGVAWGGWDTQNTSCNPVNANTWACGYYGSIDPANVQAFEINGHLINGPSTDPYTSDVALGTARALSFLAAQTNLPNTYYFNPATSTYICADGTVPQTSDSGACTGHGGQHQYNPSAKSCTSPPCTYTFDGNSDGLQVYSNDGSGETTYTTSPFLEMLVAGVDAGVPDSTVATTTANSGMGVNGMTYKNIIQDIMDWYGYDQYNYDYDVAQGYTRGASQSQGGGWLYVPSDGGSDNSTSQWAAIGYITGYRGEGLTVPPVITDMNQVWITNAQDLQDSPPTGTDPYASGDNFGSFGYRGSLYYSNAAGPFAVTPSGGVQMAMDGVGRTTNKAFGDSTTAFDQRWNNYETYYADNFCNSVTPYNQFESAPRAYMYGMYSFTKSMLLHNSGGSLAPIQYLRTQTPGVFTGNSNVPANTIDWYAALSPANGGTDPCDGVAQTLVTYQQNPVAGVYDGHWFGFGNYAYTNGQATYETAWALIMLKNTVFVNCINNLAGQGSASGSAPARVDLSWSNQAHSTSYNVLRGTVSTGPYTLIGSTTSTSYSDPVSGDVKGTPALVNGDTYFYVVQPIESGAAVCQSNQAAITVPKPASGRH